ncbi:hypothetical protein NLI96_g11461 [Meripilus lineatus]|uniref:DUF6535 domain-containing protein n=1 Tax=Meripilus lineatus TaxID=2056292 RepID=A0AAD5UT62_9APHY|nr:hypothetical protein NLI96_g11461 [Physisporinus lineatus]
MLNNALPCPPSTPSHTISQYTSRIEMSTGIAMPAIESSTRRSPSPTKKSGRSSPASSRRRSSSSKRNRSRENKIEEVSQGKEHETHDTRGDSVDLTEGPSPSPNLPGGSNPARSTGPSSQGSAMTQQQKPTTEVQVPGAETPNAGGVADAQAGEEEGTTEVEKLWRQREKQYPDIVLKPEEANAWPELSDTLTKHDGDRIDAHYQNIDTLLVLSGLFSAVVTTLIIEAYKQLQQDPADTTAQLLLQISMQLSSLSVNPGFINSTYVPPKPLPFSPAPSAVLINVLWFTSLVFSLVTASLGMLVKQWLREYRSQSNVSPEQCCQVRLFRVRGLRKYKVAEIADFLPILLQIALILFFVGLIFFARSIHASIATVVSIVVAIWIAFVVGTTLLPVISPSCPYKTPLLKSVFLHFRKLINGLPKKIIGSYFPSLPDSLFVEESTSEMDPETKAKVLMDAYDTFQNIKSWDTVMRCVDINSPLESLRMLSILVKEKRGYEIKHNSEAWGLFDHTQYRILLKSITACLRRAMSAPPENMISARLGPADVTHLKTLRTLCPSIWSYIGSQADNVTVLENFAIQLLTQPKHVLSVPHDPEFITSYILSQPGLSQSHFSAEIDGDQIKVILNCLTGALDSGSGTGNGFKSSGSLPHLLEMCRISFLCAGRATEHALDSWKSVLLQLTVRLAESLQSISYPKRRVDTGDVFRAQCALDMAMRLHTKVPGFVDKSLFQALHVCSFKMFDLCVETWNPSYMKDHIRTRNNALSTGESPGSFSGADWEEVLQGKEYVGFRILDDGNDRDEWYHEDLKSSCKQRMGFIWSMVLGWRKAFSEILVEFGIESNTPISE